MKKKLSRVLISSLFVIGLGIVGLATAAIIATLRGPASGSATAAASQFPTSSSQQPATPPQAPATAVPYPVPWNILTPSAVAAETAAAADIFYTQQAILRVTFQAYTPPPTAPFTYPPTGTREDMYVKPSGQKLGMDALNGWFGIWDGKAIGVYAGATSLGSDQGIIVVVINGGPFGDFPTPTKHGGVRVVSEQDNRLTLVSTDGTTYYFDIPSLSYVSSLTVFAPSITPPPTRTPFPPNYVTETPYPGP